MYRAKMRQMSEKEILLTNYVLKKLLQLIEWRKRRKERNYLINWVTKYLISRCFIVPILSSFFSFLHTFSFSLVHSHHSSPFLFFSSFARRLIVWLDNHKIQTVINYMVTIKMEDEKREKERKKRKKEKRKRKERNPWQPHPNLFPSCSPSFLMITFSLSE